MVKLVDVDVLFFLFRATLEESILLSFMLKFLDKVVPDKGIRRDLKKQVCLGIVSGVFLSMFATFLLSVYYTATVNFEPLWWGILALIATVLITLMAFCMIRMDTWKAKWEMKLTKTTVDSLKTSGTLHSTKSKYPLFLIAFTAVVLREGVEAVIVMRSRGAGREGFGMEATIYIGAVWELAIGMVLLFKGIKHVAFRWFLGASTYLLLSTAAGVFTGAVREFEEHTENDKMVQKLLCCHKKDDGVCKFLHAALGWRDEETMGTLTAHNAYWGFVLGSLIVVRSKWIRESELEAAKLFIVEVLLLARGVIALVLFKHGAC
ncbi:hypothetical protein R1flu_012856 [Riccia fluitans]|uniref:Iron permease FTR1 n=1 Tax=Riccia fluitans TaxID=41844 RepID=A0ABD1ZBT1_9MARC